jgi:hypothetical protein
MNCNEEGFQNSVLDLNPIVLQTLQELDSEVAYVFQQGYTLNTAYQFLRWPRRNVKDSWNRQGFNRRVQNTLKPKTFDFVMKCHAEGLTLNQTSLKLKLSKQALKSYPFYWPKEKTHNLDGSIKINLETRTL